MQLLSTKPYTPRNPVLHEPGSSSAQGPLPPLMQPAHNSQRDLPKAQAGTGQYQQCTPPGWKGSSSKSHWPGAIQTISPIPVPLLPNLYPFTVLGTGQIRLWSFPSSCVQTHGKNAGQETGLWWKCTWGRDTEVDISIWPQVKESYCPGVGLWRDSRSWWEEQSFKYYMCWLPHSHVFSAFRVVIPSSVSH